MIRPRTFSIALAAVLAAGCANDGSTGPAVTDPSDLAAIAFSYSNGPFTYGVDLFVMGADKSGLRRIVTNDSAGNVLPDWSPDGRTLLFSRHFYATHQRGLWVVKADGSGLREIPTGVSSPFGGRWSPDGKSIVFVAYITTESNLAVMRADGSEQHLIASDVVADVSGAPSWSPDGRIAFTRSTPGAQGIWTVKSDGSALTRLTSVLGDAQPRWSPDGKRLVLENLQAHSLVLVNADGTARHALTIDGTDQNAAWSPNGEWILFDRQLPGAPGAISGACPLYKVRSTGGIPVPLLPERTRGFCVGSAWRDVPGVTY
jgi:TolB protein